MKKSVLRINSSDFFHQRRSNLCIKRHLTVNIIFLLDLFLIFKQMQQSPIIYELISFYKSNLNTFVTAKKTVLVIQSQRINLHLYLLKIKYCAHNLTHVLLHFIIKFQNYLELTKNGCYCLNAFNIYFKMAVLTH